MFLLLLGGDERKLPWVLPVGATRTGPTGRRFAKTVQPPDGAALVAPLVKVVPRVYVDDPGLGVGTPICVDILGEGMTVPGGWFFDRVDPSATAAPSNGVAVRIVPQGDSADDVITSHGRSPSRVRSPWC